MQHVKEKRDRYQAVSAGLTASDSGEEKTLADQLIGMLAPFTCHLCSTHACRALALATLNVSLCVTADD